MKLNLRPIAFAAVVLMSGMALHASAQDVRRPYIVQLQDQPAATYTGGIDGLAATQPTPGSTFDFRSPPVQDYVRYLGDRKDEVIATIANAPILARYDVVVNGFSAMLTDDEVLALKANGAVADVQADVARHVDTVSTPRFLGLMNAGGLWSQFAGGSLVKGENMVIGVVDGGIWPENPAFADRVDSNGVPTFDASGTLAYTAPPASFTGSCVAGEGFDPVKHCNNKLIGAKFYNTSFLANIASGAIGAKNWTEFYSARDSNIGADGGSTGHGGHGDHTASTAAGNSGVPVVIAGVPMGSASGIAPRARVAAYKVCWTYDAPAATDGTKAQNSCFNTDSVQAIDDAVKDGVNVINYSISGSTSSVNDVVEQAFYRASLAGVFVAASAGNSGPAQSVAHLSPWLTTVAASTHDRNFQADVVLGSGITYHGASTNTTNVPQAALIRAEDAGMGGGNANLCYSDAAAAAANAPPQVVLDPAKVTGKIVICTRGNNARVDKSLAVLNASGIGMVMMDNGSGLVAESHSVPTVHVSMADGAAIKSYAAGIPSPTAAITPFYAGIKPAPFIASFSSRGPNAGDSNLLKPDLTAPGVDVIASVTPALTVAQHAGVVNGTFVPPGSFESYQGTSMSSPHVAGLALLLHQAHPTWSPAAIKSALMTTAYTTLDDGVAGQSNGLLPWSQGPGHVDPNKATDPGLVYDAGKADYVGYQCKVNKAAFTPATDCALFPSLDETYNLNIPSITVGTALATTTVRRTVTNVGDASATYTASASVPGFTTVVTPATLTLAPGASAGFTLKLTPTAAAVVGVWNFGSLTWADGTHTVKIPVQARTGKPITSPSDLSSTKTSGSQLFLVKTGFSGRMTAIKGGMKDVTLGDPATLTPSPLDSAALKSACAAGVSTASVKVYPVTVPANTVVARFALRQADTSGSSDDNDMGMLAPDGTWVYSGNGGSSESVQMAAPAPGVYNVCVLAYGSPNATMTHQLSSWVVTTADVGGSLTTALPAKVVSGNNATVGISWSGLAAGHRYMGGAQFLDLSGVVQATTVLKIETGSAGIPTSEPDRAAAIPKN